MSEIDPETRSLQDAIFLSKVARARRTPIGDKILEGPRLFDLTCQRMRDGIRHEFPDFDELRRRLRIKRKIDERGFYQDAGIIDEQ